MKKIFTKDSLIIFGCFMGMWIGLTLAIYPIFRVIDEHQAHWNDMVNQCMETTGHPQWECEKAVR
jgi:hypothetical protein